MTGNQSQQGLQEAAAVARATPQRATKPNNGTRKEPNTTHRSFFKLRWLESMTMDTKDMSLKEKPALLETQ